MSSLPMTEKIMLDDDDYAREEYDPDMPVEQRLMKNLLQNYERSVRPVRNATDTVIVKMGLTLTQIFDMVSECFLCYIISVTCHKLFCFFTF